MCTHIYIIFQFSVAKKYQKNNRIKGFIFPISNFDHTSLVINNL